MERSDKQRVLVVDDDREIVAAIVRLLEREGIEAIPAYNGREAVERLTENEIHLIIIDIMMPEMDGISATIKIRTERNIPVIMLSAKTEESDKILGLSVGADDYVTKPFSPAELIARVKSQLRRYMTWATTRTVPAAAMLRLEVCCCTAISVSSTLTASR